MTKRCGPPIGLDWAGFALGVRGPARVECTGGVLYNPATERPAYRTLSYGRSRRLGGFTCDSERIGLTCRRTSHGLFISRETWRLWRPGWRRVSDASPVDRGAQIRTGD